VKKVGFVRNEGPKIFLSLTIIIMVLNYYLEPEEVKTFLSRELGVRKDRIVEGKITN